VGSLFIFEQSHPISIKSPLITTDLKRANTENAADIVL